MARTLPWLRALRVGLSIRWSRWRVRRAPTAVLGPRHRRSRRRIEIDLTWACNLRCPNCNRSCTQAPTGDRMSAAQIRRFVDESVASGTVWEQVRLLGGEPTLHPELPEILQLLLAYRASHAPRMRLVIATNGHGRRVREVIASLPEGVLVDDSAKGAEAPDFLPFNIAPVDLAGADDLDFANGCWVVEACGMGLSPHGYYPCAVAAGIDRVFGDDLGRQRLPGPDDDMADLLEAFCRRCGHFRACAQTTGRPVRSRTWDHAYRRWQASPPALTRYGGGGG